MASEIYDLAIVGGGPAGYTAGIYAGRSGMRTVILEKQMTGGQMAISPLIENWPGDKEVPGAELSQRMREHVEGYAEMRDFAEVSSIRKEDVFLLDTTGGELRAKAVVLATGAEHRKLGAPGEEDLTGKGVSYCATCDGFFFKDKEVVVIGGGDTALIEAIYLNNIGCDVTVIHRRDQFRGGKTYQDRIRELGIRTLMDSVVVGFNGDAVLGSVTVRNVKTDETRDVEVSGAFVAIGEVPNNKLALDLAIEVDDVGYVKVDRRMSTVIPGVYAAGDLTGGLKQVVVAAAEGAIGATSAFEDLMEPYWIK